MNLTFRSVVASISFLWFAWCGYAIINNHYNPEIAQRCGRVIGKETMEDDRVSRTWFILQVNFDDGEHESVFTDSTMWHSHEDGDKWCQERTVALPLLVTVCGGIFLIMMTFAGVITTSVFIVHLLIM